MSTILGRLHVGNNNALDPELGPRISGWVKYDPSNRTTLAILGISDSGAIPGDHFTIDEACEYWNTILPIYPQVSTLMKKHKGLVDSFCIDVPGLW